MSKPAVDWNRLRSKLPPTDRSLPSKAQRLASYKLFDPNGNGYLSLAECDLGVKNVWGLYEIFNCKPVIIRAFTAAKSANNAKGRKSVGADYIEQNEYRLFIVWLRQYFELYEMFDEIDTSDDRRVSLPEFIKAVPLIEKWGVKVGNPVLAFKEIDRDGGGMVLFEEFADWALKKGLDLDTDDDFDDEALHKH